MFVWIMPQRDFSPAGGWAGTGLCWYIFDPASCRGDLLPLYWPYDIVSFLLVLFFFSPFCVPEMLQTTKCHVLWYCLDDFKTYSMQRYFRTRDFLNNVGDCSRWRSQSWHSVCPYRVKENILVTVFDFPIGETVVVSFWNSSESVRYKCGW